MALQELAAADIAFYKEKQWNVANYALLLDTAIIAAAKLVISPVSPAERTGLWLAALAVAVAAVIVLHDLDRTLAKGRDRIAESRKYFNEISLKAYACGGDPNKALERSGDKPSLKRLFQLAVIVGFGLTSWLLSRL